MGSPGRQVRYDIPQLSPGAAAVGGAFQGMTGQIGLRQAKEAQRKEDLMSILPALASMRQLSSAQPNEEGAFEAGGQWFKIGEPSLSETDKYRKTQTKKLNYEMSAQYQKQQALQEFDAQNTHLDPKKAANRRAILSDQYDRDYKIGRYAPDYVAPPPPPKKYVITDTASGEQKLVDEGSAELKLAQGDSGFTVSEHEGEDLNTEAGIFDYFTDDKGNLNWGRIGLASPAAIAVLAKTFPWILRVLPHTVALSAIATGSGMYDQRQKETGGRRLFEDTGAYAERTGTPEQWSLGSLFEGFGQQKQPNIMQGRHDAMMQQGQQLPIPAAPTAQGPYTTPPGMSMNPADPATLRALAIMQQQQSFQDPRNYGGTPQPNVMY